MEIRLDYLVLFALIFSRLSGLFVLMPVFSSRNVTVKVKIGLLFFISLAVMPIVSMTTLIDYDHLLVVAYHILIEFIIGLSFGMVVVTMLSALYLAGAILDRNIGFSMVNVISPMDESNMPVSANLYYLFAMLVFLFTDGHHILIQTIVDSLETIPLGGGTINVLYAMDFVQLISEAFVIGVRLAAPFIITMLIANIILGMLSKAMPGMNVFMIGMPFKIFVGLTLFSLLMPVYYNSFIEIYKDIYSYLMDLASNYF